MNYSKKNTINKQKKVNSTSKKMGSKARISVFRVFLACIVALVIVGGAAGLGAIKGVLDSAPSIEGIDVAPEGFSTTVFDANGKQIQKLVGSDANRAYVTLDQIPEVVQNAFIAIEDARFRTHHGIDIKGIFRAAVDGIVKGKFDSGASTITQQLLKNQVFEGGSEPEFIEKVKRKIQEQYLAIQLEDRMDKDQILEYYLNTINLGQNTLGVQTASYRYFNKPVNELDLSEATVIAGITQNPSVYNPISHPENNAEKRAIILDYMEEQGFINAQEKQEALDDNVYDRIQVVNQDFTDKSSTVNSYFVDALIDQLIEDLQQELGYSYTKAINAIYRGGLSIYTTQDPDIQKICDKVLKDESNYPSNSTQELTYALSIQHEDGTQTHYSEGHVKEYMIENGIGKNLYFSSKKQAKSITNKFKKSVVKDTDEVIGEKITMTKQPQISFTLMDQSNGQVKAIVGGRGKKVASRTLNRATNTVRQPGSTFKVVAAYLPALDASGMTLGTVFDDAEYYYPNGKKVNNWETNRYRGFSTIHNAIVASMNIVTVKTMEKVTPQVAYDYLMKLGFTSIVDKEVREDGIYSDIQLSTALGGLTHGVSNLELTAAYAAIANKGVYNEPTFYTKVVDHDGKVLLDKSETKGKRVMKETTSWLLTHAMEDVISAGNGTGRLAKFNRVNMAQAGKTGTTSNYNDIWFTGYTPYYTATIWSGYDNNERQSSVNYHKTLWRMIMEEVHAKLKTKSFKKPDGITSATICTKCGKLAVPDLCSNALGGSKVTTEYFASGTVPTEPCDCHVKLTICKSSGKIANEFCPETETAVYLIKDEKSSTDDTPYVLKPSIKNSICKEHSAETVIPPDPDPGEGEDPDPDNPDDPDTPDVPEPDIPDEPTGGDPGGNTGDGGTTPVG
ncbi:transglycosylase domain-containing protein [Anaerolentibacter hominis]|uniref:transglycosylase domain-containing protein n=1 Tax=Anaerolentibacter hominis TaxID=3079009 RepID=UPI0031B8500B